MLPAALGPLRNHTVSLDGCPDKRSAEPLDAGSPRRSILESSAKSAAACPPFRTGRSAQGKMAPSAAVPFIRSSPRESSHVRLPRRACAVRPKDNASGARLRGSPRPPIRLRRRRAQLDVPCLALPNRSGIPSATHAPRNQAIKGLQRCEPLSFQACAVDVPSPFDSTARATNSSWRSQRCRSRWSVVRLHSKSVAGRSICGVRLTRIEKSSTFWCNRGGISVRPSDFSATCSRL